MAKKKLSAREKRELEKQAKDQRWRARRETAAQAEADKKRREEMDARWTQAKKDSPQAQSKKTRTKAAGLKSVFLIPDNKLIMTSFQQGNPARVEYQVVERRAELLVKQPVFRVDNKRKAAKQEPFVIHGRNYIDAYRDDPRPAQSDLIGCKSALENQYYGRTFEDNIHIQIIHQILDVEKILAVYLNSIIYELNNILHRDKYPYSDQECGVSELDDLLGGNDTEPYHVCITGSS